MRSRSFGALGFVLSACAAMFANAPHARAAPVQIDLTIDFNDTTAFGQLTGGALFGTVVFGSEPLTMFGLAGGGFDIGTLSASNTTFTGHFIPGDPCVGAGTCQVGFSFAGLTDSFSTFGFKQFSDAPSIAPSSSPVLPFRVFIPTDPCFIGDVCRVDGVLVAYDQPVQIGTWEVTISQTPLPATLPPIATGLGTLGLLGWRRKRKHAAALAAA